MSTPQDMSRYVVRLTLDQASGLGVIARDHILTCAHFFRGCAVDRFRLLALEAAIQGEASPSEYFVQTLDCLLDFMVLGHQPIGQEVGADPQFGLEEIEPHIKPVRLVFPNGWRSGIQIPVYYFAPDGKTPISATAVVYPNAPTIRLYGQIEKGCSGGPVFTADHHLIGIINGAIDSGSDLSREVHALRLDLAATGWLCAELDGFAPLNLEPPANAAANEPRTEPPLVESRG